MSYLETKHTLAAVGGEDNPFPVPFLGLPVFLNQSSNCVHVGVGPTEQWSSLAAQATKVTFSDNLITSLVNATSSIASKTPENAEKGFLFTVEVSLEDETQNGNIEKNVALITHNVP